MKYVVWTLAGLMVVLTTGCVSKVHPLRGPAYEIGYDGDGSPIYGPMSMEGDSGDASIEQERMLVWKAHVIVETTNLSNAVAKAVALTARCRGYVESRSDDSNLGVSLRLRIPASSFPNAFKGMAELGTVISSRMANEDVTEEYVDIDARLKNKIVLRDRLRGLLDRATEVKDILAIETELNRVQGDIDSMEARIKSLKGTVDYATLDLSIRQEVEKPKKILGPLGYLFKGVFWTIEKLFVIRDGASVEEAPPPVVLPPVTFTLPDDSASNLNELTYTVQEGDTLAAIGRLFVVSEDDLRNTNAGLGSREVVPGERIRIPPAN